ncbi:MAG: N-acetylmuramoyl-L-alanine amidase [Anaerolineae bacterium]|nr:N-acetylmuramoyl-L-alanine amidase [Anaerolineae bacterium]
MLSQLYDIAQALEQAVNGLDENAVLLREIADGLAHEHAPGAPVWTDIRDALPVNLAPDDPWLVANGITDWWKRTPAQITGITIHHVASNGDPFVTARYITKPQAQGGKGLPRTQYNFWIQPTGEIICCLDVTYGPWHDNCGHRNEHVSIALNGALHKTRPTQAALTAAARLVVWLMDEYGIDGQNVLGHNEWAMRCLNRTTNYTICPGWTYIPPFWKNDFYAAVDEAREVPLRSGASSYGLVTAMGPDEAELDELTLMGMGDEDL